MDEPQQNQEPQQEQPQSAKPETVEPGQKIAELEDKYLRAVADLANAHKRFQRERERTNRTAVAAFVKKLLPVIDNLSHSLKAADESHDTAALIGGFKLVEDQILQVLGESGVKPIEAEGKVFDPELHHAVAPEITDEVAPGTVTEELGRGFRIGNFVIRPAQVKVAIAPAEEDSGKEGPENADV